MSHSVSLSPARSGALPCRAARHATGRPLVRRDRAAWHGWSPWLATSERRRSALRVGASAPQLREEKKAKPQVKEQVKAHSPPRARPVRQQPDQPADFRLFADGTAVPKPARYYRRIRRSIGAE